MSLTTTGVSVPPAREQQARTMLEGLGARVPSALRLALRFVAKLPTDSRLRRRLLQESLSRSFAAMNRVDLWFVPIAYEPDGEIRFLGAGFRTVGMAESYRVDGGWEQASYSIRDAIPDARWLPDHLIDLGDRWVLRARISGAGRHSGIDTEHTWGCIYHLSPRGRIARQDIYWAWDEALAVARLEPNRVASG